MGMAADLVATMRGRWEDLKWRLSRESRPIPFDGDRMAAWLDTFGDAALPAGPSCPIVRYFEAHGAEEAIASTFTCGYRRPGSRMVQFRTPEWARELIRAVDVNYLTEQRPVAPTEYENWDGDAIPVPVREWRAIPARELANAVRVLTIAG